MATPRPASTLALSVEAAKELRFLAKLVRLGDWAVDDIEKVVEGVGVKLSSIRKENPESQIAKLIHGVLNHLVHFTFKSRVSICESALSLAKERGISTEEAISSMALRDLTPSYCKMAADAFDSLANELVPTDTTRHLKAHREENENLLQRIKQENEPKHRYKHDFTIPWGEALRSLGDLLNGWPGGSNDEDRQELTATIQQIARLANEFGRADQIRRALENSRPDAPEAVAEFWHLGQRGLGPWAPYDTTEALADVESVFAILADALDDASLVPELVGELSTRHRFAGDYVEQVLRRDPNEAPAEAAELECAQVEPKTALEPKAPAAKQNGGQTKPGNKPGPKTDDATDEACYEAVNAYRQRCKEKGKKPLQSGFWDWMIESSFDTGDASNQSEAYLAAKRFSKRSKSGSLA